MHRIWRDRILTENQVHIFFIQICPSLIITVFLLWCKECRLLCMWLSEYYDFKQVVVLVLYHYSMCQKRLLSKRVLLLLRNDRTLDLEARMFSDRFSVTHTYWLYIIQFPPQNISIILLGSLTIPTVLLFMSY